MSVEPVRRPVPGVQGGFAQGELDTTAWDSLYLEVRRSAYRVGWVDWRVEELLAAERRLRGSGEGPESIPEGLAGGAGPESRETDPDSGESPREALAEIARELKWWLAESRAERQHLTKVSAGAIRAGLSQHVVTQLNTEKDTIGRVLLAALTALDLNEEQQQAAVDAMYAEVERVQVERREAVIVGELLA